MNDKQLVLQDIKHAILSSLRCHGTTNIDFSIYFKLPKQLHFMYTNEISEDEINGIHNDALVTWNIECCEEEMNGTIVSYDL